MQDRIVKFLAYDGRINIVCANTTNLVEKARLTHDLSPTATAALGRMITVTSIMATEMKDEQNKMTVQIRGNGPIRNNGCSGK
jgi:molecular chaperone Hsp33